ncbi:hypothetical protein OSCT_1663 [Oscillochloris trichoides DG-6]|uniref:Uncharacterized protein n=1 Tax=Oscillochloris trichoides DG-6 TaxID=765420 RepID=E1IEB2_9CHLR|nr:hypothetical protein OSCT_1663 [Oscillochloris trichoides DG-6]
MFKLLGIGGGIKLVSEIAMPIPFIGLGASTFAAFCIHMAVGVVLIIIFELRQKGSIPENYMETASSRDIAYLLRIAMDTLEEIVRSKEQVAAINVAVERFEKAVAQKSQASQVEAIDQTQPAA